MASSKGIRAGKAFVELGVDDRITRGLKAAEKRLKAFGAGVRAIGTKLAALGAGALTPLLGAAQVFAGAGDTLDKMAARTGVSVEALTVPVYHFTETHYLPDGAVTPAYRLTLFQLTGKVNGSPFKGFAAGEVLFLGASGARRGYGDWELTFRFAASPNAANLTIGDLTGIAKKGWEYLWVRYVDSEDTAAKALVKKPEAAYVERVYDDGDLALLGIG